MLREAESGNKACRNFKVMKALGDKARPVPTWWSNDI